MNLLQALTLGSFQDLLPIVYQILKHHYGLIYFSRVKILDDREFTCATLSLTQLLKLVKLRINTLESVFLLQLVHIVDWAYVLSQARGKCLV